MGVELAVRTYCLSLHHMMGLGALIGALCGAVGLYLSYYVNVASGAAIVLTTTALFAVVFTTARLRERLRDER